MVTTPPQIVDDGYRLEGAAVGGRHRRADVREVRGVLDVDLRIGGGQNSPVKWGGGRTDEET